MVVKNDGRRSVRKTNGWSHKITNCRMAHDWTSKAFPDWTNHDLKTCFCATKNTDVDRKFLLNELMPRQARLSELKASVAAKLSLKRADLQTLANEVAYLDSSSHLSGSCKALFRVRREDQMTQLRSEIDHLEAQNQPEIDRLEAENKDIGENIRQLDVNSNRACQKVKEYLFWHFEQFYTTERGRKAYISTYLDCSHREYEQCECHRNRRPLKEMSRDDLIELIRLGQLSVNFIRYRYKNVISATFKHYKGGEWVTSVELTYELSMFDDGKPVVFVEK